MVALTCWYNTKSLPRSTVHAYNNRHKTDVTNVTCMKQSRENTKLHQCGSEKMPYQVKIQRYSEQRQATSRDKHLRHWPSVVFDRVSRTTHTNLHNTFGIKTSSLESTTKHRSMSYGTVVHVFINVTMCINVNQSNGTHFVLCYTQTHKSLVPSFINAFSNKDIIHYKRNYTGISWNLNVQRLTDG